MSSPISRNPTPLRKSSSPYQVHAGEYRVPPSNAGGNIYIQNNYNGMYPNRNWAAGAWANLDNQYYAQQNSSSNKFGEYLAYGGLTMSLLGSFIDLFKSNKSS